MRQVTDPALLQALNGGQEKPVEQEEPEAEQQIQQESTQDESHTIGDLFKKAIAQSMMRSIGSLGGQIGNKVLPESMGRTRSAVKGLGEGLPESLYSGARGLAQLFGNEDLPEVEGASPENIWESVGQTTGKGVGYGAMAAPFAMGAAEIAPAALPAFIPEMLGAAGAGAALSPNGERLKGALEFAAPVGAARALTPFAKFSGKSLQAALRKVHPEKTYEKITDQYDKIKKSLTDIFGFVEKEAEKRGISKVGELHNDVFDNSIEYGPKTKSFQRTVEKAKGGDYKSVRKLYSKLGEYSRKADKANDWEKKDMFDEIQQMINDGLSEHFNNTGHKDLGKWLDAAKSGWRELKNTFESPYEPEIRKLVGENREFPKTLAPLKRRAESTKKILKVNKEVAKDVEAQKQKEAFKEALNKAKKSAITGAALWGGSKLVNQGKASPYDR